MFIWMPMLLCIDQEIQYCDNLCCCLLYPEALPSPEESVTVAVKASEITTVFFGLRHAIGTRGLLFVSRLVVVVVVF